MYTLKPIWETTSNNLESQSPLPSNAVAHQVNERDAFLIATPHTHRRTSTGFSYFKMSLTELAQAVLWVSIAVTMLLLLSVCQLRQGSFGNSLSQTHDSICYTSSRLLEGVDFHGLKFLVFTRINRSLGLWLLSS